ncbi:BadF/BadG/BcrA/BcrD ATPase family protein [Sodalis sp. dw_96]|uniref:BadF/BadG/BcrA/BcrD ATPase family protein n=1 Tax=Sodalis sp. dw_96 TaxID=2719794 RepID=UPI001BD55AC8|nr:BadF/BadG/BcrA/BcrD ATPase family protein [Sodalis sp. dw_96]
MNIILIFCIDGGGTNTRGRLYDRDGTVLADAVAGPCNVSSDPAMAADNVVSVWRACAAQHGQGELSPENVTAVIAAAGTLPTVTRGVFLQRIPPFATLSLEMDGHAALIGAGAGRPCALIIAGTGAVAHRLYPDGRSIRRDGWGWIGGDRGSGVWLGRKALRHAVEVYDGIKAPTILARRILQQLASQGGIAESFAGIRPFQIAAYAPWVIASAQEGDLFAQGLLHEATDHYERLAALLDLDESVPLFMAGGLAGVLGPGLARRLGRPVAVPAADALYGCYLIATGAATSDDASFSTYQDEEALNGNDHSR